MISGLFYGQMDRKSVGFNIRKFRQLRGITQEQLALQLGSHQSNINRIENGKQNYTLDFFFKLSETLRTPAYEFFSASKLIPYETKEPTLVFDMPSGDFDGIRCFDSPVCLGPGYNMDEMQEVGYLPIHKSELPVGYKSEPGRIVCFLTKGTSMIPTIMPDSHIIVDRYVPAEWIVPGGLYAFLLPNGEVTIKRLLKLTDDSAIIDADNQDPKERKEGSTKDFPMVLHLQEDESVVRGRVIWILNRLVEKPKK
jgi:transcriptional regulator with XRE-family HTH domain